MKGDLPKSGQFRRAFGKKNSPNMQDLPEADSSLIDFAGPGRCLLME